jgi:hypothetical protein
VIDVAIANKIEENSRGGSSHEEHPLLILPQQASVPLVSRPIPEWAAPLP